MDERTKHMEQSTDFSEMNFQYLIRIRDLALHDPHLVTSLFGIPSDIAHLLTQITPEALAQIREVKIPLMVPRHDCWWWERLLAALQQDKSNEISAIAEHAIVLASSPSREED